MQRRDSELVPLPKAIDGAPAPIHPDPLEAYVAKWMVEKMRRVQKNEDFQQALEEIIDCRRDVTREIEGFADVLTDLLAMFACLTVCRSRSGHRTAWVKVWSRETGKTWKALKGFPARLRSMAKETEQVIANPIFAIATFTKEKTVKEELIGRRLRQLPGTMGLFAMAVEAFIATTREGNEPLLSLSQVAGMATGKSHDREVANLLNAAARALDKEGEFDAMTITQARSRRKKKPKTSLL
jgi:hypothetical protein